MGAYDLLQNNDLNKRNNSGIISENIGTRVFRLLSKYSSFLLSKLLSFFLPSVFHWLIHLALSFWFFLVFFSKSLNKAFNEDSLKRQRSQSHKSSPRKWPCIWKDLSETLTKKFCGHGCHPHVSGEHCHAQCYVTAYVALIRPNAVVPPCALQNSEPAFPAFY